MKKTEKILKAFLNEKVEGAQVLTYEMGTEPNIQRLDVKVYHAIPFVRRAELIKQAVDLVFMNGGKTIESFAPEHIKFAKRVGIIDFYTDFKLPHDINDIWLIVNNTPLFDDVAAIIGKEVDDIFGEIDRAIDARVAYLSNKTDINGFLEKMTKTLDSLSRQFTPEDINRLVEVLGSADKITPDKILDVVAKVKPNEPAESPVAEGAEKIIKE